MNLPKRGMFVYILSNLKYNYYYYFSDPNNPSDEYLKAVNWPLYSDDKKYYLEIGQNLNVKLNDRIRERIQAWDNLFSISQMLNPLKEQCKI